MFTESPLNIILSKWVILIGYVEVLESGPTHGQRYDALRAALELVCHDVSELINERYLQLHRAATTKLPKRTKTKKLKRLLARSDQYVGDGRRTCRRIGRALEQAAPGEWRAEANLVEVYDLLLSRLEGQNFEPLDSTDLPRVLKRFCKRACGYADKIARADSTTLRERRTAGLMARKAVAITLVVGGLAGFEQALVPVTEDVVEFVTTIMRGLERLIHDDEFVLPLPSLQIRPPQLNLSVDLEPDTPSPDEPVEPKRKSSINPSGSEIFTSMDDIEEAELDTLETYPEPEPFTSIEEPPSGPERRGWDGPGGP
jgi:hypothetical protein